MSYESPKRGQVILLHELVALLGARPRPWYVGVTDRYARRVLDRDRVSRIMKETCRCGWAKPYRVDTGGEPAWYFDEGAPKNFYELRALWQAAVAASALGLEALP